MGKASRKAKHGAKMNRRRAAKVAKRTKYAALAGTSKKAKRQNKRSMPSGRKHAHLMADCGNVGCEKCYGLGGKRPKTVHGSMGIKG